MRAIVSIVLPAFAALVVWSLSAAAETANAGPKDDIAPVAQEDAWTALENEQLGLTMAKLLDDTVSEPLRKAAQARYGLDDDGGERFMICMMGLGGHPDFTAARVKEALDLCSRTMAPAQK